MQAIVIHLSWPGNGKHNCKVKNESVYYIKLWSATIVINIYSHYENKLHQQLILSVGFVIKQIVFKFCFTCGDYIDSLGYCHSQLRDTRYLLLLLPKL